MKRRIVLTAEEGMVLTDGTYYGTIIWLAEGVSPDSYHPIPLSEYEAIMAAQEEQGNE